MKNKLLTCIVGILTGFFVLFIPNYVAETMYDSPYEGAFYITYFIIKCLFLLLGVSIISYGICFIINKRD
ncbi:hypothetical protein J42TS3_26310 [Paenibacillus vini]|uniref:Uncharacterized protein n=1 Tax=Paenibacillus vini TaxID=1476024 RepID=A0ABQ4MC88_9BACL|nr:hypothetical protein J42TS3_26310 [Paenibacillus vini]